MIEKTRALYLEPIRMLRFVIVLVANVRGGRRDRDHNRSVQVYRSRSSISATATIIENGHGQGHGEDHDYLRSPIDH